MSGLVSVVFLYKSSLKMVTPLLNCSLVEQQSIFLWSEGLKLSEISDWQQAQGFSDQVGSFAP